MPFDTNKSASRSRYCEYWKASNGKWYVDLASDEYGEWDEATTYGPFPSENAADKYVSRSHSNPGGYSTDDEGTRPPPKRSPNGDKVVNPSRQTSWGGGYGRWAAEAAERVSVRYLEGGLGAPRELGSTRMLSQQGYQLVDVFFGEARPRTRPIADQGDTLQDKRGNIFFFVGVDAQGAPILADTEQELKLKARQLNRDRLRHTTPEKRAVWTPGEIKDDNLSSDASRATLPVDGGSVLPGDPEEEDKKASSLPIIKVDLNSNFQALEQYPKPSWDVLKGINRQVHLPFPGHRNPDIRLTSPNASKNRAEAEGEALSRKYRDSHWPGGMGEVVALVRWDDEGSYEWQAVVNLYYSYS
jgi:hypothetical protein